MYRGIRLRPMRERASLLNQRFESFTDLGERSLTKPGPRVADVNQLIALVDAEKQGPESPAAAALDGEAGDDGLPALVGLDLEPGSAALPGDILAPGQLGDDPFNLLLGHGDKGRGSLSRSAGP